MILVSLTLQWSMNDAQRLLKVPKLLNDKNFYKLNKYVLVFSFHIWLKNESLSSNPKLNTKKSHSKTLSVIIKSKEKKGEKLKKKGLNRLP